MERRGCELYDPGGCLALDVALGKSWIYSIAKPRSKAAQRIDVVANDFGGPH